MRIAVCTGVSTQDQDCDLQLRELREYCSRRCWGIAGEYVDTGWSGAKMSPDAASPALYFPPVRIGRWHLSPAQSAMTTAPSE
jgi:hypothetical protein